MTRGNRCPDALLQPAAPKRHFTLTEANRALVLVKRIVADIVVDYARLLELLEALEAAEAAAADEPPDSAAPRPGIDGGSPSAGRWVARGVPLDRAHEELARTSYRLRACLEELDDVGVQLVDWSSGSVVFPSIASGREVSFCWQYGEARILFWQEADISSQGRLPIRTLLAEMAALTAQRP